jgi:hypothetical protein
MVRIMPARDREKGSYLLLRTFDVHGFFESAMLRPGEDHATEQAQQFSR